MKKWCLANMQIISAPIDIIVIISITFKLVLSSLVEVLSVKIWETFWLFTADLWFTDLDIERFPTAACYRLKG